MGADNAVPSSFLKIIYHECRPAQLKDKIMDERVTRLKTPDECEQFALNVKDRLPELARDARRRGVELRAAAHGAKTAAEREALEAVYAYERVLWQKHGKKIRASRTWQMIKNHGIIEAVEQVVKRKSDSAGYTALVEMGMKDLAFEVVVLRHPEVFSQDAVAQAAERLKGWDGGAELSVDLRGEDNK